ncbi:hypothetical protein CUMW_145010 [Citrus unshiu]|nr:hypothetical protein CUMW_145010 [Citrus unshiu]
MDNSRELAQICEESASVECRGSFIKVKFLYKKERSLRLWLEFLDSEKLVFDLYSLLAASMEQNPSWSALYCPGIALGAP